MKKKNMFSNTTSDGRR